MAKVTWKPENGHQVRRAYRQFNPTLAAMDLLVSNMERLIEDVGEASALDLVRESLGLQKGRPNGDGQKTYQEMRDHIHDFLDSYGLGR